MEIFQIFLSIIDKADKISKDNDMNNAMTKSLMDIKLCIQNERIYILIKHTWKIYKKLCTRS